MGKQSQRQKRAKTKQKKKAAAAAAKKAAAQAAAAAEQAAIAAAAVTAQATRANVANQQAIAAEARARTARDRARVAVASAATCAAAVVHRDAAAHGLHTAVASMQAAAGCATMADDCAEAAAAVGTTAADITAHGTTATTAAVEAEENAAVAVTAAILAETSAAKAEVVARSHVCVPKAGRLVTVPGDGVEALHRRPRLLLLGTADQIGNLAIRAMDVKSEAARVADSAASDVDFAPMVLSCLVHNTGAGAAPAAASTGAYHDVAHCWRPDCRPAGQPLLNHDALCKLRLGFMLPEWPWYDGGHGAAATHFLGVVEASTELRGEVVALEATIQGQGGNLRVGGRLRYTRNNLNLPGGKPKAGESLEQCLQREVEEETCIHIKPERFELGDPATWRIGHYELPADVAGNAAATRVTQVVVLRLPADWAVGTGVDTDLVNIEI